MDWWDSTRLEVSSSSENDKAAPDVAVDITCTPAQHFTGRGVFDRFKTLWASWVVEEVQKPSSPTQGVKVFFGGDTDYRAVKDDEDEDKVPVCPAFKDIGDHFGGFDLAMIPIGSVIIIVIVLHSVYFHSQSVHASSVYVPNSLRTTG